MTVDFDALKTFARANVRRYTPVLEMHAQIAGEMQAAMAQSPDGKFVLYEDLDIVRAALPELIEQVTHPSAVARRLREVETERDRLQALLHAALVAMPPRPLCRDCADHNGTCQSEGKEPCDPYEALPGQIVKLGATARTMRPVVAAARRLASTARALRDDGHVNPLQASLDVEDVRKAVDAYEATLAAVDPG